MVGGTFESQKKLGVIKPCSVPQRKLVLWYTRRTPGARSQSYEDNIRKIVDFSTVRVSLI